MVSMVFINASQLVFTILIMTVLCRPRLVDDKLPKSRLQILLIPRERERRLQPAHDAVNIIIHHSYIYSGTLSLLSNVATV